ncbi:MAG: hypothetical protein KAS32_30250 [Candidatus Peribacteraceae bacterium]|nr:hypothetical protein [Candidatus Peribacteraceae bacterium]
MSRKARAQKRANRNDLKGRERVRRQKILDDMERVDEIPRVRTNGRQLSLLHSSVHTER